MDTQDSLTAGGSFLEEALALLLIWFLKLNLSEEHLSKMPKSDGLHPKSDGLQPKSDDLHPSSDGLQLSDGLPQALCFLT